METIRQMIIREYKEDIKTLQSIRDRINYDSTRDKIDRIIKELYEEIKEMEQANGNN